MKTKENKRHVRARHRFWFSILRPFAYIIAWKFHFKPRVYKIKKNEPCLILSNHQANLDPIFLALSVNKPVYFVSSEHIFHKGFVSKLLVHCVAPIPRKKGDLDVQFIMEMIKVAKEGGNIAIFLEGNRTWTNSQFPIGRSCVTLVRKLGISLVLFNLKGGFGVDPRFGGSVRKGPFTNEIRYHLSPEQIQQMSDDELYELITKSLDVKDASNGELYKSDRRAEYLERMMFICPCCKSKNTLRSEGAYIHCSNCNESIEYTEDLKFKYQNEKHELLDYYKFQLDEVVKDEIIEDKEIFHDDNVVLYDQTTGKRIVVQEGIFSITDKGIVMKDFYLDYNKITSASLISGTMLTFNTKDKAYIAIGNERFNPMKYIFYFDRLVPSLKNRMDNYYGINIFKH